MEPITYYIYEIPGKKVGCTKRLRARIREQKALDTYRVIATTQDLEEACRLERYWQINLGYKVDATLYSKAVPAIIKAVEGKIRSEEHKKAVSEGSKKRHSNPETVYPTTSRARYFKELSTGFVGTFVQHRDRFNIVSSYISDDRLGVVRGRGKFKGMCWIEVSKEVA